MKKGFTLIELLVVVLIIGILAAIALPQYTTAVEKSRATEALSMMGTIRYAAERYRLQMETWPAGNLDYLDIEVPKINGTSYSSKFFTFTGANDGTSNWKITATRYGNGPAYSLITTVTPAGTATRSCSATGDANIKICKAISSGSMSNF